MAFVRVRPATAPRPASVAANVEPQQSLRRPGAPLPCVQAGGLDPAPMAPVERGRALPSDEWRFPPPPPRAQSVAMSAERRDDAPKPSPSEIALRFLRETAHLGPEGQRRVIDAVLKAGWHRTARIEAQRAIESARAAAGVPDAALYRRDRALDEPPAFPRSRRVPPPPTGLDAPPANEDR